MRARHFLAQLATDDRSPIDTGRSLRLILGGLFKKIVIADILATQLVDGVFANPRGATGLETLLAIYGYALQIYGDFSGYSDIAIGIALLLGFRFGDNFDQPYRATSLQEFWRRWHISLSSWLRDYLYVSLGGSRRGRLLTYRNLLITMLVGGLWHGAGWTFVVWGALHGAGLVVERWVRERRGSGTAPSAMGRVVRTVATFHLVCVGWVFFRAVDLERAGEVLAALAGSWTSAPSLDWGVVIILVVGATAQFLPRGLTDPGWSWLGRSPVVVQALVVVVAIVGMDVIGPDGVAPFIYFQF